MAGILYLVSTPIGNLEDITLRAARQLFAVDLILCEDTRRTGRLLEWLQKESALAADHSKQTRPEMMNFADFNEESRLSKVIERLQSGQNIALVTSAGTPLLSDPGFKLVRESIRSGIKIESLPGANAVLPALQLSGLPPDKFLFLGFLPKKSGQRRKMLENALQIWKILPVTVIGYESPYRLLESLETIRGVLGEVSIAVCRELTKMHEETFRGSVSEALDYFKGKSIKGEFTLVFGDKKAD